MITLVILGDHIRQLITSLIFSVYIDNINRKTITALSRLETKRTAQLLSSPSFSPVMDAGQDSNPQPLNDILSPHHDNKKTAQDNHSVTMNRPPSQMSSRSTRPSSRMTASNSLDSMSHRIGKSHAGHELAGTRRGSQIYGQQQRLQRLLDLPKSSTILSLYPPKSRGNALPSRLSTPFETSRPSTSQSREMDQLNKGMLTEMESLSTSQVSQDNASVISSDDDAVSTALVR